MITKTSYVDTVALGIYLKENFKLAWQGIHGSPHWARVKLNGHMLHEKECINGARLDVIVLFAFLHDHMRFCDGDDPLHGHRAAENAVLLRATGKYFEIDDEGFDLLCYAMRYHSDGLTEADVTVQCCWDADRLDLTRIGNTPDPRYLCTPTAKQYAIEKYWS
jgi:uncharacterized protein